MAFDPGKFLKDLYASLGVDTSDLSPFTRYVIEPITKLYEGHFKEYAGVWDTIGKLADGDVSAVSPEELNLFLSLFGVSPVDTVPAVATVQLLPTADVARALRLLSREYKEGTITFTYDGYTFTNKHFIATSQPTTRTTIIAEFYCDDPDAVLEENARVSVSHPDFVEGVVLSFTPGRRSYDPQKALEFIAKRLTNATYAASEDDLRLAIAKQLVLDESLVKIVGANHPMMLADLASLNPRKHVGGFVDVYLPVKQVNVTAALTAIYYEDARDEIEAHLTHPLIPYCTDLLLAGEVPIDDTNGPKSFLGKYIDRTGEHIFNFNVPVVILRDQGVTDVYKVMLNGRTLQENTDYAVVSLNRAMTFSSHDVIAIVLNPARYYANVTVMVSYTRAEGLATLESEIKKHQYIAARLTAKSTIPVWITGNVSYTGEVDYTALQMDLAKYRSMDSGTFISLLKKHGAENVAVSNLRARLVSPGFGFFEESLPVSIEDFRSVVPYPELCTFTTSYDHLRRFE